MRDLCIVAHRGSSETYPENTLLAFQKAVELGVDFIEIDVHETADGELVVIHDGTLERTTDGKGCVKELTYEDIRKFDAGKWKGPFEGVKIPSLDEVLSLVYGKTRLWIEIKEAAPEKIIKQLRKHKMENSVVIGSFNMEHLTCVRRTAPSISTSLISVELPASPDILVKEGIPIVDIAYNRMTGDKAKEFIMRGISLAVWTVDDENDMKQFLGTYVSFITTNRPDILKKVLRSARLQ